MKITNYHELTSCPEERPVSVPVGHCFGRVEACPNGIRASPPLFQSGLGP